MDPLNSQTPSQTPVAPTNSQNSGGIFPTYSATPVAPRLTELNPRRKSHKILISIIILVILIGVGGVFGYSALSSAAVMSSLNKIDSTQKLSGKVSISLISDDTKISSSFASVLSQIDRTDATKPAVRTVVDVSSPFYSGDLELRVLNKVIYVKASALNDAFAQGAGFPASLWYSISFDALKKMTSNYQGVSSPEFDAFLNGGYPQLGLASLYQKMKDARVVGEPKFKSIKNISGTYVRVYELAINKDALADFMVNYIADQFGSTLNVRIKEEELAEGRTQVKKQLEKIAIEPILVSVSLFGDDIREARFSVSADKDTQMMTQGVTGVNLVYEHDPAQDDFNIAAPDSSLPLDTIIEQSQRDAVRKAEQARVQTQLSSMRVAFEIFYDSKGTYKGACTSSDTVLMKGQIKSAGYTPICRDSSTAYLVGATGYNPTNKATSTLCFDSKGGFKNLLKAPTGYTCTGAVVREVIDLNQRR